VKAKTKKEFNHESKELDQTKPEQRATDHDSVGDNITT